MTPEPEGRGEDSTQRCDVCLQPKPADMVDRTTVATFEHLDADVCEPCQFVQNYSQPEGACLQCGDDVDVPHHLEVEFPLGDVDAAALLSGSLCGDCAGEIAIDVLHRALGRDEAAHEEYIAALDEETERLREIDR